MNNLRHKILFFAVFILGVSLFAQPAKSGIVKKDEQAFIKVNAKQKGRAISPFIFGSNIQWEYNGDGIIEDFKNNEAIFNPRLAEKIKNLKITALRFPGGSLADKYNWKNGIGKIALRKTNLSFDDKLLPSNFGLDEFMRLCKLLSCEPIYTVNFNIAPYEAAEIVEYCHGIKYWEIGNEIYSAVEKGHTSAQNYARKYLEFYQEMKKVDPAIKIGADFEITFQQAPWAGQSYPYLLSWNKELIEKISGQLDFVSLHFYAPFDYTQDLRQLHYVTMAAPKVFSQSVKRLSEKFAKAVPIWVTEYNAFFDLKHLQPLYSFESALFQAAMLMESIKVGASGACNWSLLNNGYFGMIKSASPVSERPVYKAFKLMRDNCADLFLDTQTNSATFNCAALGVIPRMDNLALLETLATADENSDTLYLVVLNKSFDQPVSAKISLDGFDFENKVRVEELYVPNIFADNESSERVNTNISVIKMGNAATYTFKPHSLTAFRFNKIKK